MFTQAEIKAYLLTQGLTVKTIKATQLGVDTINVFNPKVIYYGHTQGLVQDFTQRGTISLYIDNSGTSATGDEKNPEQPGILQTSDFFFRYAELENATAVFNGYIITLV